MEKTFYYWDYSSYSDIFNIHKKDKITKGSAELGDFSIDFDEKENIVGVEIMHASEFFKTLQIDKPQLQGVKYAAILVDKRNPQITLIYLKLMLPNKIERMISIPTPVISS